MLIVYHRAYEKASPFGRGGEGKMEIFLNALSPAIAGALPKGEPL